MLHFTNAKKQIQRKKTYIQRQRQVQYTNSNLGYYLKGNTPEMPGHQLPNRIATTPSMVFPAAAMRGKHLEEIGLSGGWRINSRTAITTPTQHPLMETQLIEGQACFAKTALSSTSSLCRTRLDCRFYIEGV